MHIFVNTYIDKEKEVSVYWLCTPFFMWPTVCEWTILLTLRYGFSLLMLHCWQSNGSTLLEPFLAPNHKHRAWAVAGRKYRLSSLWYDLSGIRIQHTSFYGARSATVDYFDDICSGKDE